MRFIFASLLLSSAAFAAPNPVEVKVREAAVVQPCKCEGEEGTEPSKVQSSRCFLKADIDPLQPVEPFAKMFLLVNQVKAQQTLVQVPDERGCKFKRGEKVRLFSTDTDPGFLESTPRCGAERPEYARTCEPYGRFVVLFRSETLRAP